MCNIHILFVKVASAVIPACQGPVVERTFVQLQYLSTVLRYLTWVLPFYVTWYVYSNSEGYKCNVYSSTIITLVISYFADSHYDIKI